MADPSLVVQGLPQLRRALRTLVGDLADLKAANAAVSRVVAAAASSRAPRRTGRLAASVRPTAQAGRAQVRGGGAAVPYAGPIHWGWPSRKLPAQGGPISANPFVSDGATETEATWLPLYVADVQRAVDRVSST